MLQILQNERHCGDVLARKTWTPNYLDHKSKKNKQDRNQYKKRDHHEAIISRDDFIAVQHLISNAKYGHKGILPKLQVIPEGGLKGFVSVNPRWAGFHAEDYHAASDSVYDKISESSESFEFKGKNGDFDLRGFEIARAQFFDTTCKISFTLSSDYFQFSRECMRKLVKTLHIEILVHPRKQLLVIRPCNKKVRNAIRWANVGIDQYYPRKINCAAYIDTLYKIFGWTQDYKYRVQGLHRQKDNEKMIIYDIHDSEMFIPQAVIESEQEESSKVDLFSGDVNLFTTGSKNYIKAYPSAWADSFGNGVYQHARATKMSVINTESTWQINEESKPFNAPHSLNVTDNNVVSNQIERIIYDMKQEVISDGE